MTPVPLPAEPDVSVPDEAFAEVVLGGIAAAVSGPGGLTPLQSLLLRAICSSMTGWDLDPEAVAPIHAGTYALALTHRSLAFRGRMVQVMLLGALILQPLPRTVSDRVREYAAELGVTEDVIDIAEAFAEGALDLAAADFARNGYLAGVDPARLSAVHAESLEQSWAIADHDPALASRWRSLESLDVGTLGRGVADFYRDRGFVYPGLPGSAPPLLAQHDWVHVLAGYGTSLESELEVFAFMSRATEDPRGFSLLAMVVSLFETGYLAEGAGLFMASPGHLQTAGMPARVADAMRRGTALEGSWDFLGLDWFAWADRPVEAVRASLRMPPKAPGLDSPTPWDPGGVTAYQLDAARTLGGAGHVPWRPDPSRR